MSFNEDTRVKIPATIQFLRLGYNYQSLKDGIIDTDTKIFKNRMKPALKEINKRDFTDDEIDLLVSEILKVTKNNDLGKEFYNWLINPLDKVKLIDFEDIDNNDFAVVNELSFGVNNDGSFIPDITILVNGIPLAFLEVKKPNNEGGIQVEFERMINDRFENVEHKKTFNMLQMITFSNNMEYEDDEDSDDDPKAGSFYTTPNGFKTTFSFFREEEPKIDGFIEIDEETVEYVLKDNKYSPDEAYTPEFKTNMDLNTPCNRFVTSIFEQERFLYYINYGIAYIDERVPQKHIMRYPQFFATRELLRRLEEQDKGGVIWHAQGSGKTATAAFSNRVVKDYYAKKGINTRFFFIVDRLDLLRQASSEFKKRGYNAINVKNIEGFSKELDKVLSTNTDMKSHGDFTVVNIHKLPDEMPIAKNDYAAKVKRIIFIDEAHRSYKFAGDFFRKLMLMDEDAIYIALTGTPLLNKERTSLKFGNYIHKYFYDKSIADGYTLRIKREEVSTAAKAEIKKNLALENPDIDKDTIFESDAYIVELCKFIHRDFESFRYQHNDMTIGGMIVCNSNPQAIKVQTWFENNSKFKSGLVISDEIYNKENEKNQITFKESLDLDFLVVHKMLTTGYDVSRLKKMYLLKNSAQHTLLQTISRVNRPYKKQDGSNYKYGYIVDFVDIESEYNRTISEYVEELEAEIENEDGDFSLSGFVIGADEINEKYLRYKKELDGIVDITNIEEFSKSIIKLEKVELHNIRKLLVRIKESYTEFLLSDNREYASQIDIDKVKKSLREVQNRIDFVNLRGRSVDTLAIISNTEVVNILYEFIKVRISILDLSKFIDVEGVEGVDEIIDKVKEIQKEIKKNKHKEDIRIVNLDELLKNIFEMLEIADLNDLSSIDSELLKVLKEVRNINIENERLAAIYDGNYAFVKTYNDYCAMYPEYDKEDIEAVLLCIHESLTGIMDKNRLVMQGRTNFITNIKHTTAVTLLKANLYKKLNLKDWYDQFLGDIYVNVQMYK